MDNALQVYGYAQHSDLHTEASKIFGTSDAPALAKRVYQMVFAGYNGSTFPVGYWPVKNWNSGDVLTTALEAIEQLRRKEFMVRF